MGVFKFCVDVWQSVFDGLVQPCFYVHGAPFGKKQRKYSSREWDVYSVTFKQQHKESDDPRDADPMLVFLRVTVELHF